LVCVIFYIGLAIPATAATIEAGWNAVSQDVSGQPESISHYMLYYGELARPANVVHPSDPAFAYDHQANVGNVTRVQQGNLAVGQTYYFAVTAVDTGGNLSNYSGEVSITVPKQSDGGPPGGDSVGDAGADSEQQVDGGGSTISSGCGCTGARAGWILILFVPFAFRKRVH